MPVNQRREIVRQSYFVFGWQALWPWLMILAIGALVGVDSGVWLGFRISGVLNGTGWHGPDWSVLLVLQTVRDGPAVVVPGSSPTIVWVVTGVVSALVLAVLAVPVVVIERLSYGLRDPARSLAKRRDLRHLTAVGAAEKAVRIRPMLAGLRPKQVSAVDCGIPIGNLRPSGVPLVASWEDNVLAIMGPRTGKTSALAIPTVLSAPGWVAATANTAALWAATSRFRESQGRVWTFDPMGTAGGRQTFWWNPLRIVRDFGDARDMAYNFTRLLPETPGSQTWVAGAHDLLASLMYAAALAGHSILEVDQWVQDPATTEPAALLDSAHEGPVAEALRSRQRSDVQTRAPVYEMARAALAPLRHTGITKWVSPPRGYLDELVLEDFVLSTDTLYLMTRDRSGTGSAVSGALAIGVMSRALLAADARGGRIDPPGSPFWTTSRTWRRSSHSPSSPVPSATGECS